MTSEAPSTETTSQSTTVHSPNCGGEAVGHRVDASVGGGELDGPLTTVAACPDGLGETVGSSPHPTSMRATSSRAPTRRPR